MGSGHGVPKPDKANHPGRKVTRLSGTAAQDILLDEPGTGVTTDSSGRWSTGRAGPVATGPHAGTARELRAGGGTRLPIPPAKVRRYPPEPYNWESRGQS